MIFFKDSKEERDIESHMKEMHDGFIADFSYKIREPLNSICGLSEIVTRNVKEDGNKEQILMYLDLLKEAADELQQVVDVGFTKANEEYLRAKKFSEDDGDYSILNNLRVLVCEDSNVNQMIVKELLEEHGARVVTCNNGREGYKIFAESITGTYDIILMDIKMPVMDGYEATDLIRRADHPQAKSIPIIAMTAEAFAEDVQRALESGMNAHVSKPFNLMKIVSAIRGTYSA